MKKGKKKRESLFMWKGYVPTKPSLESQLIKELEVVYYLHFEKSKDNLNNTKLGINILMYVLANKYR